MFILLNKRRNRKDSEKGAVLVEYVLTFPFVLLSIALVIMVGQLLTAKIMVENAAFQGARAAVVLADDMDARSDADKISKGITESVMGQIDGTFDTAMTYNDWKKGEHIDYTVTTEVKPLFPMIGLTGLDKIKVTGHMVMMIENEE